MSERSYHGATSRSHTGMKENVLFNDALSSWTYGKELFIYIERGNPLPPIHGLLFLINSIQLGFNVHIVLSL